MGQGAFDMGGYVGHLHVQSLDWTGGLRQKSLFLPPPGFGITKPHGPGGWKKRF